MTTARVFACVSEDLGGVWTDGIRGAGQLHQIQQRRAQEVRHKCRVVCVCEDALVCHPE